MLVVLSRWVSIEKSAWLFIALADWNFSFGCHAVPSRSPSPQAALALQHATFNLLGTCGAEEHVALHDACECDPHCQKVLLSTYGTLGGCLFPDVMKLGGSHAYCVAHERKCEVDPPQQSDEERFLAANCLTHDFKILRTPIANTCGLKSWVRLQPLRAQALQSMFLVLTSASRLTCMPVFKSHSADFLSRIQAATLCISKLLQLIIGLTDWLSLGIYLRPSVRGFFENGQEAGNSRKKLEAAQKVLPAFAKIQFPRGGDRECPWVHVGASQERAEQAGAAMVIW